MGVKFKNWLLDPDHAPFRAVCYR